MLRNVVQNKPNVSINIHQSAFLMVILSVMLNGIGFKLTRFSI